MSRERILVVDDEPINLEIIREYLEEADYELELVESATQAWARMDASGASYDVAILDRMMPGMSGIEMLRRLKSDDRFRAIPVIMQTAAGLPEQVREGIEAGAFYYLTKPYAPETLLAIVRAALADVRERREAMRHAFSHNRALEMLQQAEFSFRRLDEIGPLIEVLSSLCPAPEQVALGLTELLVNAVEHGSLGFSYADKKRLRLENRWEEAVAQRFATGREPPPPVSVRFERQPGQVRFQITDRGPGFDWRRYLEFDPARAADPNGRGIAMARMLSFAAIEYQGSGNVVLATISVPDTPASL